MVIVRKGIVCEEVTLKSGKEGEVVCAKISVAKSPPMYVCAYYRPPKDTVDALDSLDNALEEIEVMIQKNPRSCVVVAGDFNAPGINWDEETIQPDCPNKGMCSRLIDILSSYSLKQFQKTPTRLKSILDLFCTNKPGLVKKVSLTPGISDHDGVIIVDMALRAVINKKAPRRVPLWSKADWNQIKSDTAAFSNDFLSKQHERTPEENWAAFKDHIDQVKKSIPSKFVSERHQLPWLSSNVKRMCRTKRKLYNKAKKSGSNAAWSRFKHAQNKTRNALRTAHWNYVNSILQEGLETGDSKKFWRYVKAQKQDSQGVAPLRTGTTLHTDALSKAKALSKQFSSVFTRDTPETADTKLSGPSYPEIPDLVLRTHGIQILLEGLNPSKASGPDEVPARLLKTLAQEIAPVLTSIFKQSVDTGYLPKEWSQAWITPVFKKGSRSDPANYRPVSLTCIACKLLEHCITTHIRSHLDAHGILTPLNHGFRKHHSCETQLLLTTHDLLRLRDKGKQVDVAILDFSKAFDTVPHRRLLGKMEYYGITGNIHKWVESFLTGRKQAVVVDGVRSEEREVLSGVPQGTVLGPLLFLLHINDLPSVVHPDTRCRLFADDCLLYRAIDSISDQLQLQADLRALEQWAAQWGMRFNAAKCYIMTINRGRSSSSFFYQLCSTVLSSVTNEKYLGVLISQDLSWSHHIQGVVSKAKQKLGFLRRNLRGCPADLKKLAYISMVRSSVEYASIIWDPHLGNDISALEKVQRGAARWIKSDYSHKSSVTKMLNSLELVTLEERRRISRLVFLYKVLLPFPNKDAVAVHPPDLDISRSPRPPRGLYTKTKLDYDYVADSTELLTHFVAKSIPQWNRLPESATSGLKVTSATFKARLSSPPASSSVGAAAPCP